MLKSETSRLSVAGKSDYINAIFENAREGFRKALPQNDPQTACDSQDRDRARQELGQLLEEATVQFTTEQIGLKRILSSAQYEAHCERHGEIIQHIAEVIALCDSSRELSKSEACSAFDNMYADYESHHASLDNPTFGVLV